MYVFGVVLIHLQNFQYSNKRCNPRTVITFDTRPSKEMVHSIQVSLLSYITWTKHVHVAHHLH